MLDHTPRIALVGYGGWGPNLARVLSQLGHLSAIYDASAAARLRAQHAHPSVVCQAHWRPDAAGYDAVVLATPAASHAALAQAALHAGLDVLVEKPLALSCTEARQVCTLAHKTGRIVMLGHLLLYHPAVQAITSLVRQKALGPLRQLLAERHNFGVIRTDEDVIFSLGPHDVAAMLHITAMLPTHVIAQGQSMLDSSRVDACQMQLVFSPTLSARISLSWLHPLKAQRLVVQGAQAALIFDDVAKHLHLQPMALSLGPQGQPKAVREAYTALSYAPQEPLHAEVQAFVDATRTRQLPLAHAQHGYDVVRVLAAAQASLAQGGRQMALTDF